MTPTHHPADHVDAAHPQVPADSFDVRHMAHAVWLHRWVVLLISIAGLLAGLAYSLASTRFVSSGLLLLPSTSLTDYRRYETAIQHEPRLTRFLQLTGEQDTAEGLLLKAMLDSPTGLIDAVKPEFTNTDRDSRQFGVKLAGDAKLVGVRLTVAQKERTDKTPLRLLAEYIRDTAIRLDADERVLQTCLTTRRRNLELRNEQLNADFSVVQLKRKVAELDSIRRRIPNVDRIDVRQVVSVDGNSERFLSPIAQIVATEASIADIEIAKQGRDREVAANLLREQYYCLAHDLLKERATGRQFLFGLEKVQQGVMHNADSTSEIVERTSNELRLEREGWKSDYLERTRFVVDPEGAMIRVRKPGRLLGMLLGGSLGFLFGLSIALVLGWWKVNRADIVSEN